MERRDDFSVGMDASRWMVCGCAAALIGCAGDEGPNGPIYGLLDYACLDDTDIVCDGAEPSPQASDLADHFVLAVGGSFDVQEHVNDSSTDVFDVDGFVLRTTAAGLGVVVGASGAYAHFEVREVDTFSISQGRDGVYEDAVADPLVVADVVSLRVAAIDASGELLAGAHDVEWVSGDETILALRGRKTSVVELTANMPGTTTLTLRVGTIEQELNVEVPAD